MKTTSSSIPAQDRIAAVSAPYIPTCLRVVNSFTISGVVIAKDFRRFDDDSVAFTIVHRSFANNEPLYTPCIMYSSVNGRPVCIPWTLLQRGNEVIVRGFRKPHDYRDRDGVKHKNTAYVALAVIPNDGRSNFMDDVKEA